MASVKRKLEARQSVLRWANAAPGLTTFLYGGITWRNPFYAVQLVSVALILTQVAVHLCQTLPAASLLLLCVAVSRGASMVSDTLPKPALFSPRLSRTSVAASPSSAATPMFDDAVDAFSSVVAAATEWRDLMAQQKATRPGAFAAQAVGALCVLAWVLAKVPTAAVVWIAVGLLLTVPGFVAHNKALQEKTNPVLARLGDALLGFVKKVDSKLSQPSLDPKPLFQQQQ